MPKITHEMVAKKALAIFKKYKFDFENIFISTQTSISCHGKFEECKYFISCFFNEMTYGHLYVAVDSLSVEDLIKAFEVEILNKILKLEVIGPVPLSIEEEKEIDLKEAVQILVVAPAVGPVPLTYKTNLNGTIDDVSEHF